MLLNSDYFDSLFELYYVPPDEVPNYWRNVLSYYFPKYIFPMLLYSWSYFQDRLIRTVRLIHRRIPDALTYGKWKFLLLQIETKNMQHSINDVSKNMLYFSRHPDPIRYLWELSLWIRTRDPITDSVKLKSRTAVLIKYKAAFQEPTKVELERICLSIQSNSDECSGKRFICGRRPL